MYDHLFGKGLSMTVCIFAAVIAGISEPMLSNSLVINPDVLGLAWSRLKFCHAYPPHFYYLNIISLGLVIML